jgi:hypothetical protein
MFGKCAQLVWDCGQAADVHSLLELLTCAKSPEMGTVPARTLLC